MKYIRTEDGIYEVENDMEYAYKNNKENHLLQAYKDVYEEYGKETNWTDLGEIVEIADTIEELCDEFVFITEDEEVNKRDSVRLKKHIFMRGGKGFSFSITERDNKEDGYYGAIWTDKGLIYVAKMNDKGEFELL